MAGAGFTVRGGDQLTRDSAFSLPVAAMALRALPAREMSALADAKLPQSADFL